MATPVFLPGESHGQEEAGGLQFIESQRIGTGLHAHIRIL